MSIDKNIVWYIKAMYPITDEEEWRIIDSLRSAQKDDKKKILIAVYNRYEDFIKNAVNLKRDLDIVWNNIEEISEKQNVDDLFKDIV